MLLRSVHSALVSTPGLGSRSFSTTKALLKQGMKKKFPPRADEPRRVLKPWNIKFPVRKEEVAPWVKGGSQEMYEVLEEEIIPPTGITHRLTGQYMHVPEMVPELIVPDLTGFELKPYVDYKAKEISQHKLTPEEIFMTVYSDQAEREIEKGNIRVEGDQLILRDGKTVSLRQLTQLIEKESGEQTVDDKQ